MRYLSNKEKRQLSEQLPPGYMIDKKEDIKEEEGILFKGDDKFLIVQSSSYLPHLKSIPQENFKSVYVDKGAIPFIAKGADLMRPGIQEVEHSFSKGDIVMVKDENLKKTIALGIALLNSEDLEKQEKGKSLDIYHYVGDELY